ncbi:winged helix-turn-helix domain-containing protein [Streptomyces aureocirculatus]|uniref:winged helix-turn-helix domain-containing protein n=1 Tax=Streptomyces aureocirculatus TaxID=67275 RepID=UPI000A3E770E|nr:winged helix-turn-helix domain-containing protein [Streptomyces aureocirculatus]
MILDLIPPRGWSPTFLTPADAGTPQEVLERVRATPRSEIREHLAHVAEWHPLPSWANQLPDDSALLRQLFDSLDHVCTVLLIPHWNEITGDTTADQTIRMRHAIKGGMEHLLANLHPQRVRWNAPVLEMATLSGFDGDLHLEGRGLLLAPSVFARESPSIDIDARPQPVLRYPISDQATGPFRCALPDSLPVPPRTALASLLGPTRAAVLQAIAEHPGCTTKQLATLVRITSPSASEHATILRSAGLIHTTRYRNAACHSLTAVGTAFLNAPGQSR